MKKLTALNSRALLAVGGAGLAVLAVAWWMALMSPAGSHLTKLKAQQQSLESNAQSLTGQLATLKQQKAHSASLEAAQARDNAAMPATVDLPGFINQMNALAAQAGVDMSSLSPTAPSTGAATGAASSGSYRTMTVSIAFKGTYGQVMTFLQGLYQLPRLLTVDTVSVSGGGAQSNPGTVLNGSVQARVFVQPPVTAAVPAAPAAAVTH